MFNRKNIWTKYSSTCQIHYSLTFPLFTSEPFTWDAMFFGCKTFYTCYICKYTIARYQNKCVYIQIYYILTEKAIDYLRV